MKTQETRRQKGKAPISPLWMAKHPQSQTSLSIPGTSRLNVTGWKAGPILFSSSVVLGTDSKA